MSRGRLAKGVRTFGFGVDLYHFTEEDELELNVSKRPPEAAAKG